VDVVVLALAQPGRPRRVLALGEAKWAKVMEPRHVERLRRAAALLAERGYDTSTTVYACYGGAGFSNELRALAKADNRVVLVSLVDIYAPHIVPAPAPSTARGS
jgi:uncharacterized protein